MVLHRCAGKAPELTSVICPLDYGPIAELGSKESWIEKYGKYLPIVGWIMAGSAYSRRAKPVYQAYCHQLNSRPALTLELWEGCGEAEVIRDVCQRVQNSMDWPTASFIPEDPCGVLWWSNVDGLAHVEMIIGIEDAYNIHFRDDELQFLAQGTMADFVKTILILQSK